MMITSHPYVSYAKKIFKMVYATGNVQSKKQFYVALRMLHVGHCCESHTDYVAFVNVQTTWRAMHAGALDEGV